MQHEMSIDELGTYGPAMSNAVRTCVHCGFCLPACPTYQVLGSEMDSPRGRIFLMKEVLEGRVELDEAAPYIDRCLGCLGCVTACPSGVPYGDLLTLYRGRAESRRRRPWFERWTRRFVLATIPYPGRFRRAAWLGQWARRFAPLLPARMRAMTELLPSRIEPSQPLPATIPAQGPRRARVALLAGCAQQVLAPDINWATVRVLAANGVETVVPRAQVCCGAMSAHTGDLARARSFARANLAAFPDDVDAILTNAAGCGSGMREYGLWFVGTPLESQARRFADRTRDVAAFLDQLGLSKSPPPLKRARRVAYHDACHLAHAQKVREAPRRLLQSIGGLTVLEIPNGEFCCGSAGTYNMEQPETADILGRAKAEAIASVSADTVVTGNIGCMMQIESHLRRLGRPIPVMHTMAILDAAYRGDG
ncbi:MAG: 4Fe-4S dicluster domain-containing protein [Planctomycetes bacterium]|nr:4Fe-4S dicluster domain-containing protein [Planctomycetota bacterium]